MHKLQKFVPACTAFGHFLFLFLVSVGFCAFFSLQKCTARRDRVYYSHNLLPLRRQQAMLPNSRPPTPFSPTLWPFVTLLNNALLSVRVFVYVCVWVKCCSRPRSPNKWVALARAQNRVGAPKNTIYECRNYNFYTMLISTRRTAALSRLSLCPTLSPSLALSLRVYKADYTASY